MAASKAHHCANTNVSAHFFWTVKYLLTSLTFILTSCSTSVDGLWIEKENQALLKFYGDSVINNSNITSGRLGYRITRDSLTWTGLNPEWNYGKTEKSFKYELTKDSLFIWYGKGDFVTTYFKVDEETYHDYFFKRNKISLTLPKAENVRQMSGRYENLDIKIGFRDKAIVIYVQDIETDKNEIGGAIGRVVEKADSLSEFSCRFFVDEYIPCEYTIGLFDVLRLYDIRRICFITKTDQPDEFVDDFSGLTILIPKQKIEIVEEKNER